jgi:protein O-mannosyl-transferase
VPPSRVDRTAALVLFVAVCVGYFNAFAGGYQFDDFNVIVRDTSVATLGGWFDAQPSIRPLLKLTYALNNLVPEAWGLRLYGFHVVNLLIHLVATLLVYAVLRRLTHDDDIVFRDQRLAAFVAALVFALHPAQTEAVTYISGRSTSLAAMFALLSMLLWLRGREYEDKRDLYVRSPLVFVLALLCKEYVAVLPLALLLLARLESGRLRWLRPALRDSAVHWGVVLAAAGAALAVPRYRELALASLDARDLGAQLLTQVHGIAYLVGQLVRFDRLNADPALPVVATLDAATMASAATIVGAIVIGFVALRRYPVLGFSILWFFLWIAPTNSLLPRLDVANDRQLYLALIGPALGITRLVLRLAPRALQWALVATLFLALALATWQRNGVYADEIAFWRDVAEKSPHNARAFGNLGFALAMACRANDAERALHVAFELDPAFTQPVINLALLRAGTLPGLPSHCATAQASVPEAPAAPAAQAVAPEPTVGESPAAPAAPVPASDPAQATPSAAPAKPAATPEPPPPAPR